mmetsp:Transcript_6045/g.11481  ORF Transcript_6045/g.11481 Transcript_6045/m.11481 type:complete len:250 (-) Transcript_6045:169-918(-)
MAFSNLEASISTMFSSCSVSGDDGEGMGAWEGLDCAIEISASFTESSWLSLARELRSLSSLDISCVEKRRASLCLALSSESSLHISANFATFIAISFLHRSESLSISAASMRCLALASAICSPAFFIVMESSTEALVESKDVEVSLNISVSLATSATFSESRSFSTRSNRSRTERHTRHDVRDDEDGDREDGEGDSRLSWSLGLSEDAGNTGAGCSRLIVRCPGPNAALLLADCRLREELHISGGGTTN